ncbi:MAG: hypothetical protein IJ092_00245 [Atopobiaceae bacterium]|nr:hypothetical protein [Atopobiaceae bacterium]
MSQEDLSPEMSQEKAAEEPANLADSESAELEESSRVDGVSGGAGRPGIVYCPVVYCPGCGKKECVIQEGGDLYICRNCGYYW